MPRFSIRRKKNLQKLNVFFLDQNRRNYQLYGMLFFMSSSFRPLNPCCFTDEYTCIEKIVCMLSQIVFIQNTLKFWYKTNLILPISVGHKQYCNKYPRRSNLLSSLHILTIYKSFFSSFLYNLIVVHPNKPLHISVRVLFSSPCIDLATYLCTL